MEEFKINMEEFKIIEVNASVQTHYITHKKYPMGYFMCPRGTSLEKCLENILSGNQKGLLRGATHPVYDNKELWNYTNIKKKH